MEVFIRPFRPADGDAVFKIEEVCFSVPWSKQAVEDFSAQPHARFLVAEQGGEIIGYVGAFLVLGEADITNIGVLPEFRRKGVASALLRALCQRLAAEGGAALHLEVRSRAQDTLRLYESHGFTRDGLRKGFYHLPDDDAILMTKSLLEGDGDR